MHFVLLITGIDKDGGVMTEAWLGEALSFHVVTTNTRKLKHNKKLHEKVRGRLEIKWLVVRGV